MRLRWIWLPLAAALPAWTAPLQEAPLEAPPEAQDEHDHADHAGHDHAAHAAAAGDEAALELRRGQPWPAHTLELAASLPIQEGGRVKPLSTYADFALLRFNGKRSVRLEDGTKLSPIEWLLDTLFFPTQAAEYPVFLVQNQEVIEAMGLDHVGKEERDRYSLAELEPGLEKLWELAGEYHAIEERSRSSLQQQIVGLWTNVYDYGSIISRPEALALVPPRDDSDTWLSVAEDPESLQTLAEMVYAREDLGAFEEHLASFHGASVARAEQRGEYGKVPLELFYYRVKAVPRSLYLFVLAFLAAAVLWLRPRSALLHRATIGLVMAGTALLVAGIVMRCVIRGRPPVSTLYETVLFVVSVGSLTAIVTELINKQRVAISAAAVLGMVGMFVANGYELLDKRDTMPSLVAVLDTNFWLATHVTCITAGYSAGMLAALLASVYLVAKALRLKRDDPGFYKNTARMVYGVTCFGLLLSLVGTILGGIWANESWGRFWGWDPKENGALLICICMIAAIHGRMGGYLRDHGTCMAAAFTGTVVAFSWWGVNLLGVGLHSYGFTSGVHSALWTYYGIQWGIVGLGGVTALAERAGPRTQQPADPHGPGERAERAEPAGTAGKKKALQTQ
jgi:ABC-type transport system involved in cytochrome c biogenesis permease subunit